MEGRSQREENQVGEKNIKGQFEGCRKSRLRVKNKGMRGRKQMGKE